LSKRVLRTFLYILAASGIVLAILVAVLLLTPFGGRMAASIGWSMAAGDSGVELFIGSTRGSLVRGITFEDVRLTTEDGTRLLVVEGIGVRAGAVSLSSKRVELSDVRVSGGELLFATDDDGKQLGWSQLGGGQAEEESPDSTGSGAWEVGFDIALADVTVVVRSAVSGLDLVVGPTDGTVSGTAAELDAVLRGAAALETPGLREPITAEFDGSVRFVAGEAVELASFALRTSVGEAVVTGTVRLRDPGQPVPPAESHAEALQAEDSSDYRTGPSADLVIESTHDLSQLAAFLPETASQNLRDATGNLTLTSEIEGPFADLTYSSSLRADGVTVGLLELDLLTALLAGDAGAIRAKSLHAEGMGGTLTAAATVEFPGGGADTQFPHLSGRAEFKGLELDRLAALAPERDTRVSGTLGGTASFDWTTPGLSNLDAAFDLNASRLIAGERDFGSPSVRGRVTDGLLVSSGSCCGVSASAIGQLTDSGLQQVNLSAATSDLAVLAAAFGRDGPAGSGTIEVELTDIGSSLSLAATAEFPDLRYRHIQAGPVSVEASGLDGSYDLLYEAFDSTLLGRAALDPDGDYTASVRAHAFDLAAVLEDSLREAMSLAGLVTGTASVSGGLGGAYTVTGEISELDLAARRQNAALTAPFSFTASPDSIRLTEARLEGTFGEASVAGRLSTSEAIDIAMTFDGAELSELAELLPRSPDAPPRGQLAGSVLLAGTRDAPVFSADVRLREFEMAGFAVESATLEASGDSSDVVFYLTAESAGSGVILVSGSAPVAPDSVTVLRFDSSREFGVSIWTEGFTLDAGESVLPQVRGEKRFRLDGSVLVTGAVDSLASINGSGQFAQMSAAFDLAEFTLADTVGFEVEGGVFRVDQLVIDVVRTHVLGDPDGGRLVLSSSVVPGGDVSLSVTAEDLDVGHVARALGYSSGSQFRGRLNAEAVVGGLPSDPRASFSWFVDSPRIADFGFDRAQGAGTLEAGVVRVETVEFLAGNRALRITGEVDVRSEVEGTLPGFDMSLTADGFRLKALTALPPELASLEGRLDADLRVRGSSDGVSADGTLSLTDGEIGGADLAKPARHVALDLEVKGETVLLNHATAEFGDGSVDVSGLADLSSGLGDPTFFMTGQFKSPEFEIKNTLEGRVAGNIDWGGMLSRSVLRGHIVIEEMNVTRSVGISDFVGRGPTVTIVRRGDDPRSAIGLDLDVEIEDAIEVYSNVADLSLEGGASIGGTLAKPRISGSVHADEGTFSYLDNDFEIDALSVSFIDPERRDPYVDLSGVAEVESRSGESYRVTARLNGYLSEAVPELDSTPSLSRPDIVSLLTFGDTFGTMTSGDPGSDSSGGAFSHLASTVFLSSAFGLAESTLERLLHLDRVAFEQEELAPGDASETETETSVTLGKKFGDRLRVNYSTAVGHGRNQRVEISFELAKRFWLQSRTDPEGNHAVGLKLQIPFK
jgi:hypothetical protein